MAKIDVFDFAGLKQACMDTSDLVKYYSILIKKNSYANNLNLTKMEKDTVLLSIETYNELRDFKQKIESGNTIITTNGFSFIKTQVFTNEKAIKDLVEANKSLQKENECLRNANKPKEITLNDIRKMSYWEFRKWRKS